MYELPKLPYEYAALEPYIDVLTMEIHHRKHHNAYVANLNKALGEVSGKYAGVDIETLLKKLSHIPKAHRMTVRNNGGGHYNHSLFWETLTGDAGTMLSSDLADTIHRDFGSLQEFKEEFAAVAVARFGSGWAWLTLSDGHLIVESTPNQDNPIITGSGFPIFGLDVWEHAYYLNYQNRRPDYVKAIWNVVNWEAISDRFESKFDLMSDRPPLSDELEARL